MTEQARTARDDLAFMKAVVDDRGPLPAILGTHLLLVGLAYAPNLLLVWAMVGGRIDTPDSWLPFSWIPGTVVWLPFYLLLQRRMRGVAFGPSAIVFGAAWMGMAGMTFTTVAVLIIAQTVQRIPYMYLWPALAFVLYGGAWTVVAISRRRWWIGLVALGSFATAVVCGALAGTAETWLAMCAGLLLFFAVPGYAIIRSAPRG